MPPELPRIFEHWRDRFHGLMPFRIREILLVSSAYDAFLLEEDGPLSDQLFSSYSELNLSAAPRITHVSTIREAIALLKIRPFQLVVTVVRVQDGYASQLSRLAKEIRPQVPVALLTFDEADLQHYPNGVASPFIDHIFLWTGDPGILIATIKLIEDQLNVGHDTTTAGVQVILVVEDQVRTYSTFLSLLYPALLTQSQSLIAEGLNDWHRLMRMKARPKILLARDFDEAVCSFGRWQPFVQAVISDVRFPRAGAEHPEAGLELCRTIRAIQPETPVLLQSSESHNRDKAKAAGAWFIDKLAPDFLTKLRHFLVMKLGFGDFVFVLEDGSEVARARNCYEMEQVLRQVPAESVRRHAERHDISMWLKARSMFELAHHLRRLTIDAFDDIEACREYMIKLLEHARLHEQEGVVTDFSDKQDRMRSRFVRIGRGSLGGKGRSVGFVSSLLVREDLDHRFGEVDIRIPKTVAIGTDEFERFMAGLDPAELETMEDQTIRRGFMERDLSAETTQDLHTALQRLGGPLAVRSSSLLEDSRFQPFAGVYATYMLPNNHPSREVRFAELCRAIRAVYASAFSRHARNYGAGIPHGVEEEKMAVVVQQVAGQRYGQRFYPHLSGVAQSYNPYPIGHQRAEDGVGLLALGMGQIVVAEGLGLRFSPANPTVLPQFPDARAFLRYTQKQFYALDLSQPLIDFDQDPTASLGLCDLAAAEEDGTLTAVGSVYCSDDDVLRDNLALPGPRVVTFNNVLKWNMVPLAEILVELLGSLRDGIGGDVEIEFALDFGDWGRSLPAGSEPKKPRLYILQVRPMPRPEQEGVAIDFDQLSSDSLLCRTDRSLGHGYYGDVCDVVYARRTDVGSELTRVMAKEVAAANARLREEKRPYLLIGPGRWGTSDPALGVPVEWAQISRARVIIETPIGDHYVEASHGTHFFYHVTAARAGYLTATPEAAGVIDWTWLEAQPSLWQSELVRHVRLPAPLRVFLDGRQGRAAILKPSP